MVKVSREDVLEEKNRVLDTKEINVRKGYLVTKRFVDIIGALCGIILLFPIFIIVTLLIKYEDPKGTVFFKQARVGKSGREFYMYKFRSMSTDAEEKL
ncbi:sugar transferase, partial [Bacillus cereus group sp. BfR-BA-01379]|uniref:sugar transferase n=1 Tax=Bacillus cereus group sp. BfR-BA-01379 TaxID=2920323 RepID=UPI001F5A20C0